MKSKHIFRVIRLAKDFNKRPSEIMCIDDEYTAFCFDEACSSIEEMLRDKDVPSPQFTVKYESFSDLYKQYDSLNEGE